MLTRPWVIVCLSCLLVGSHSFATTIIPPVSLAELGKDSHAVVLARSRGSWTVGEEWLATRTSLVVETSLSGGLRAGTIFEVETPGGDGGSIAMAADQSNDAQVDALSLVPASLQDWNNIANSSLNIAYGPTGTGADSGGVVIESNLPGMAQVLVPLSGTGTAIPGGLQIPGDCNQDGAIDISDPVCLLGFLFLGRPTELPCGSPGLPEPDGPTTEADFALMDWNGDRNVDLSDVVAPLNALFGGALPHVLDVSGTGKSCIRIRGCPNVCVP